VHAEAVWCLLRVVLWEKLDLGSHLVLPGESEPEPEPEQQALAEPHEAFLREVFPVFDMDCDGKLSREELIMMLG
jgi:hypothetical protein